MATRKISSMSANADRKGPMRKKNLLATNLGELSRVGFGSTISFLRFIWNADYYGIRAVMKIFWMLWSNCIKWNSEHIILHNEDYSRFFFDNFFFFNNFLNFKGRINRWTPKFSNRICKWKYISWGIVVGWQRDMKLYNFY